MMLLYSLALAMAAVLSAPLWGWRMLRQGRYREGLSERLGKVPQRLVQWVAGRPVVWVHAVSVGEVLAATRLITELEAVLPGHAVVVSTTTPTGQRVARERAGVDSVFFYPLDAAFAVRAYLRALQPRVLVLMESELWPRMLVECERAGVPVAVVNGRVSDRSLPRYMALRMLWRPLLRRVALLLAQSDEDARRWRAIGAARVEVSGNLKFDGVAPEESPLVALVRKYLSADARVLVCGSTHENEEAVLLDCWAATQVQGKVMLLAPRHPQRAEAVEALVRERGLVPLRLSAWRLDATAIATDAVLIVDTVGELAALYALAAVAFLGGSLVPRGGQNPLEAARMGVPVVMGPHYENFRAMVEAMLLQKAICIVRAETVCDALAKLLEQPDGAMGERGRAFADSMTGATGRTVDALEALLRERAR